MRTSDVVQRLHDLKQSLSEAGVLALYLFGSTARDGAGDTSDVDLIVDPDYELFDFVSLIRTEALLAERLGRPVDLVTREGLHPGLRASIEREAVRVV